MDIERRAADFAAQAHGSIDQRRKFSGEPYINHPRRVAAIVRSVRHTPEMLAAAWLHDVVEDTPVGIEEIRLAFGVTVADLVTELTKATSPADGDRQLRKAMERVRSSQASPAGQTIKVADVIDNVQDVSLMSPKFARVYLPECFELVSALTQAEDALRKRALQVIRQQMS
jgi:(p)ppGpp synthase/HD superfamily hydrolase